MLPNRIFRTAPFRFVLALSLAFSTLVLLLFGFIYWQTAIYDTNRLDGLLTEESRTLAGMPPAQLTTAVGWRISADLHRFNIEALFGPDQHLIAGNLAVVPQNLLVDGEVHSIRNPTPALRYARMVARQLPGGDVLVIGRNTEQLVELREVVTRALLLGLAPALLLSFGISLILSWRTLNRIAVIRRTLQQIIRGAIHQRLPTRGTMDDLDLLVQSVNRMLDEIADLLEELRGIGGNIAHDLRAPLARLRARLERSRSGPSSQEEMEGVVDQAITDLDQLSAIITALLRIGEIESAGRQAGFAKVELAPLAQELDELYQPIAEAAEISFALKVIDPCSVIGDRDLLMEACVNLVDNAIKFTPAGGAVTVSLYRGAQGPVIQVADSGPGIPINERSGVMKRFYRSDKSRHVPGSGLGLSLVQAIVRLHGFSLKIVGEPPGCVFELLCAGG